MLKQSFHLGQRLLHGLPAEMAHDVARWWLRHGYVPDLWPHMSKKPVVLGSLAFAHPVGLAAGFDKNADCIAGLARLGFSFIEVGTVTPLPQSGNPKPRLFRLPEDQAIINRMGFNNRGHAYMRRQLQQLPAWVRQRCRIGVNIGKNKDSVDAYKDYALGIRAFSDLADYLVINISSPNTPGLRDLQESGPLRALLTICGDVLAQQAYAPPLFLKIAPDLDEEAMQAVASVVNASNLCGVIVSNTTVSRPVLASRYAGESGGLSGLPLRGLSTQCLAAMRKLLKQEVIVIGAGGIMDAQTAMEKKQAGAALVQVYTGFIYNGAALIPEIINAWTDHGNA